MKYDALIVGGGIVGLATALQLQKQKPGLKLAVLEKESELARHQTGNNSGVIHSGIYYKPGSLKAQNCIRGYELLLAFCRQHDVPFELCGKVIVATEQHELPLLENLYQRGLQNGLGEIRRITADDIREYEPYVTGLAGIHVPYTGIVDYKRVAEKYGELIRAQGGEIHLNARVSDLREKSDGLEVITPGRTFETRLLINCAGLYSDKIAALSFPQLNVRIVPFRGEYYKLRPEKEYLVRTLVYPVPDPNFPFLGVHFTRMAKGGVEAGPNAVLAFSREGYKKSNINLRELGETLMWPGFQKVAAKYWRTGLGEMYRSFSKAAFTRALQKLIPEIQESDLMEGGAGVRAQACDREGGLVDDFLILEGKNVINVCNAPSPAATSSLAIGETVSGLAMSKIN
ncbi:MAG: L-2-hydroxyglutarate oxidase [Cyclobacteriaceae bacterium]